MYFFFRRVADDLRDTNRWDRQSKKNEFSIIKRANGIKKKTSRPLLFVILVFFINHWKLEFFLAIFVFSKVYRCVLFQIRGTGQTGAKAVGLVHSLLWTYTDVSLRALTDSSWDVQLVFSIGASGYLEIYKSFRLLNPDKGYRLPLINHVL